MTPFAVPSNHGPTSGGAAIRKRLAGHRNDELALLKRLQLEALLPSDLA